MPLMSSQLLLFAIFSSLFQPGIFDLFLPPNTPRNEEMLVLRWRRASSASPAALINRLIFEIFARGTSQMRRTFMHPEHPLRGVFQNGARRRARATAATTPPRAAHGKTQRFMMLADGAHNDRETQRARLPRLRCLSAHSSEAAKTNPDIIIESA